MPKAIYDTVSKLKTLKFATGKQVMRSYDTFRKFIQYIIVVAMFYL